MAKLDTARCPECGEIIELDLSNEAGDVISCPGCDAELEIVKLHPPRLRVVREMDDEEDEEESSELRDDYSGGDEESLWPDE